MTNIDRILAAALQRGDLIPVSGRYLFAPKNKFVTGRAFSAESVSRALKAGRAKRLASGRIVHA